MRSPREAFKIVRMNTRLRPATPPLFEAKAEIIQQRSTGKDAVVPGTYHGDVLRREVQNLPKLDFLPSDFSFGALFFAQVEDERDALASAFKQRSSEQHGHAATIFPEKLLLVWLYSPGCQCFGQGTVISLTPLGR